PAGSMARLKRDRNAQAELTGSTDQLAPSLRPQLTHRSLCACRLNAPLSVELPSGTPSASVRNRRNFAVRTSSGERRVSTHLGRSPQLSRKAACCPPHVCRVRASVTRFQI